MAAIPRMTRISIHRLAVVVATKDRPDDLGAMLDSLAAQSHPVAQVVVVDAGRQPAERITREFPRLAVTYVRHLPPSAARQRNAGVLVLNEEIELVAFLDDDAVLEPIAVEKMLDFWRQAPSDVAGAAFNIVNPTSTGGQWLKRSRICEMLGLYRPKIGQVAPSGWHTVMDTVSKTCYVDWIATTAAVWRRAVLHQFPFDDYFEGYSYLEDLDFSFTVGKHFKLAVVADAPYRHFPSPEARISHYHLGKMEVANRLYFVKKHGLSVPRCYLAIAVRLLLTLMAFGRRGTVDALRRACGNIVELGKTASAGILFFGRSPRGGKAAWNIPSTSGKRLP